MNISIFKVMIDTGMVDFLQFYKTHNNNGQISIYRSMYKIPKYHLLIRKHDDQKKFSAVIEILIIIFML